jgi:hypothetical protein
MADGAGESELHAAHVVVEFRFAPEHVEAAIEAGLTPAAGTAGPPLFSDLLRALLAGPAEEWDEPASVDATRHALHELLGARADEALGGRAQWQSCSSFSSHAGEVAVASESQLRQLTWDVHRAFAEPLVPFLPTIRPAIGAAVVCAGLVEARRRAMTAVAQSRLLGEPCVIGRAQEIDLLTDLRCRRSTLLSEVVLHLAAGPASVLACAVDGVPPDAEPRQVEAVARGVARLLEQRAGTTLFTTAPRSFHAVVPWPAEQATRTAEDVRAAVAAYRGYAFNLDDIIWEYPALGDTVRVSVGVASGAPGDAAAGLLAAADAALAKAAADGDRVVVASV